MKKTELANTLEITLVVVLFFSILALMLNSLLPTVVLKNSDYLVYFNYESMRYSLNAGIQNLYNDVTLVNSLLWLTIIFMFIAFFGVIMNISRINKNISYYLLGVGSLSVFSSSIACYVFIMYNFKVLDLSDVVLAYIIVEPFRYAYFIFFLLIIIVLVSVFYVFTSIPILYNVFKDVISKDHGFTLGKSFKKPVKQVDVLTNNKENVNMDFYFKEKNDFNNNLTSKESKTDVGLKDKQDKSCVNKETMDKQNNTMDKNFDCSDDNKSVFLDDEEVIFEQVNVDDDVKLSETFEKALFSAIDKIKKRRN